MRVKAKLDMPIDDFILLYKLSKKDKCNIGTFIRRCLANYLHEHYSTDDYKKLMQKPLTEHEWNLIAKIDMHQKLK